MANIGRARRPSLGVAVVGFGWMGRVHTQAYARVLHHFPGLAVAPELAAVADDVPGRADEVRRMNELGVSLGETYQDQPVSIMYVGPDHGEYAAFQPGSAVAMSYDDLKVIEAHNFLRSITEGTPHGAILQDAVRSAAALDAMARSAQTGTWVKVATA
jgi:predicted dehydrogenase